MEPEDSVIVPEGQCVVITGAAGALGTALVGQLLARESGIVVAGVRSSTSELRRKELAAADPARIRVVEIDHEDPGSVRRAAEAVASWAPRVDMLVNCAGVNVAPSFPREASKGPLGALDPEALVEMFRVNAVGPVLVVQAFAELLDRAERPWVVNVSTERASLAGVADGRSFGYAMTKAALNMATRKIAAGAAGRWRVVAVHPGWFRSSIGGTDAPLDAAEAAGRLLTTLDAAPAGQEVAEMEVDRPQGAEPAGSAGPAAPAAQEGDRLQGAGAGAGSAGAASTGPGAAGAFIDLDGSPVAW